MLLLVVVVLVVVVVSDSRFWALSLKVVLPHTSSSLFGFLILNIISRIKFLFRKLLYKLCKLYEKLFKKLMLIAIIIVHKVLFLNAFGENSLLQVHTKVVL